MNRMTCTCGRTLGSPQGLRGHQDACLPFRRQRAARLRDRIAADGPTPGVEVQLRRVVRCSGGHDLPLPVGGHVDQVARTAFHAVAACAVCSDAAVVA